MADTIKTVIEEDEFAGRLVRVYRRVLVEDGLQVDCKQESEIRVEDD